MCGADDRRYCSDVSRVTMTDFGFKDNPSLLFAPRKSDVQGWIFVASRAMSQMGILFLASLCPLPLFLWLARGRSLWALRLKPATARVMRPKWKPK